MIIFSQIDSKKCFLLVFKKPARFICNIFQDILQNISQNAVSLSTMHLHGWMTFIKVCRQMKNGN